LDEESLLETPLDKVEPYGLFKHVLMSMSYSYYIPNPLLRADTVSPGLQQEQPQLYGSLTEILSSEEQQIIQAVIHEADVKALAAANAGADVPAHMQVNGGN
jgi:importin-7